MRNQIIKYICYFIFFVSLSFFVTIFFNDNSITVKRGLLNYFSFTTYILLFPLVVLTEIIFNKNVDKIFEKISYLYICLIFFGFSQIIFSELGINLSYENLTESAPENRSTFLGINLLRPNSLFGEPRNFASIIFPIYFLRQYFEPKMKKKTPLFLVVLFGFLFFFFFFFFY